MNFEDAKGYILNKLKEELDPRLTYHSIAHTMDVLQSAIRLGKLEKITTHDTLLLKTATLYHDSGMLKRYVGHEDASVEIIRDLLPAFDYTPKEIDLIAGMILTTKLPQSANTHLEMILCDADLDYLGRDDFFMIAHQLHYEWNIMNFHQTTLKEWYQLQLKFLSGHHYFTPSAIALREASKAMNLKQIMEILPNEI